MVFLSSAFWIEENADCATDTDCQNNCDRYDEQGVVQQFLEPSKQNVKWLLVKPDLKWQLLARNALLNSILQV